MRIGRVLQVLDNFENNTVFTGHSLGGGLASAASVVSGFRADTFNAAGLLRSTLQRTSLGNPYPGNPIELARYDNASELIDAYYLDWDILSTVQDSIWSLQDAIGYRQIMDGPLDFQIIVSPVNIAGQLIDGLASGSGWLSVFTSLGATGVLMGKCHTTYYYHYGLMVDETTGWDIYGYDNF
jgi:hypothetical protein